MFSTDDPRCAMLTGEFEWEQGTVKYKPFHDNWYLSCKGSLTIGDQTLRIDWLYHLTTRENGNRDRLSSPEWRRGGQCGPIEARDESDRPLDLMASGEVRYKDGKEDGSLKKLTKKSIKEAIRGLHAAVRERVSAQDALVAFLVCRVTYLQYKWRSDVEAWKTMAKLSREKLDRANEVLKAGDILPPWEEHAEYLCQSIMDDLRAPNVPTGDPDP